MNKKILTLSIASLLTMSNLSCSFADDEVKLSFIDRPSKIVEEVIKENKKTVVIRVGEYKNKPGKRVKLPKWFKLDDKYEVTENNEICEFEINKEVAESIAANLREINPNLNVVVQYTQSAWSDLNRAGRIALQNENLAMYLSIHSNAHENKDINGYMFLTGKNSTYENNKISERLSNAIKDNGKVKQRKNNYNVSYIGELNELDDRCISSLLELGFFTNLRELRNITSEEYVSYLGLNLAQEINNILE